MRVRDVFSDVRYVGQAQGDRRSYSVFESRAGYLVVAPNSARGFYVNIVKAETPQVIQKAFQGRELTAKRLRKSGRRPDLFRPDFAPLNSLYVMVALGRARKLKRHEGKSMVFKIK